MSFERPKFKKLCFLQLPRDVWWLEGGKKVAGLTPSMRERNRCRMGSCVARSTVYSWLVWPSIRIMDKINQITLLHKLINVKFIILLSKLSPTSIWQFRPILTGILLWHLCFYFENFHLPKIYFFLETSSSIFCRKAKMDYDKEDSIPHSKLAFTVLASVDAHPTTPTWRLVILQSFAGTEKRYWETNSPSQEKANQVVKRNFLIYDCCSHQKGFVVPPPQRPKRQ